MIGHISYYFETQATQTLYRIYRYTRPRCATRRARALLPLSKKCFGKKIKISLNLGKKGLDFGHLWVKSSIQNVVLRVSKTKKSKVFLYFFVFLTKCLLKYPSSTEPPMRWTISACVPADQKDSYTELVNLFKTARFYARLSPTVFLNHENCYVWIW